MFSQDSLKNVLLILVVIVVFSGVGFYTAFYMQEDKITGIVSEKNSTVTRLSSEVVYLRNVFDDLLVQYERLEDQVEELRDEAAQQSAEYERLSQMYAQLNGSHQGLLDDYRALNSSYVHETEAFLNKTTMQKDYIRVYLNNVSLEYHQDTAVSLDGPHESVPTNCSQLITGWPQDGRTTVTLSWSHVEDEPDLNATLTDARGSIELYVNKTSLNHTLVKDDYRVLYYNFTIEMGQEMRYMLISTWYMSDTGHQYLCVVQQDEDTVVEAFLELMARFERN
jgi:hypothetical protein